MDDQGHKRITREGCERLLEIGIKQTVIDHIIVAANIDEDLDQKNSAIHFDNCAFAEGIEKIKNNRKESYQNNDRFSRNALKNLGRALHTIQDFYAHSNWVEFYQDSSPVPIWDLCIESLPPALISGTWERGYPKKCNSSSTTHDQMNKDKDTSPQGSTLVGSGPNQGRKLFDLAKDAAVQATANEIDRFLAGITRYRISTVTGDCENAGTDADVFIELWESEFQGTGRIYLNNIKHNDFEQNTPGETEPDQFLVGNVHDYRSLSRIKIGYSLDEHLGRNPGWFLKEVRVENIDANLGWVFPCNRWLAVDENDGRTLIDLFPQ